MDILHVFADQGAENPCLDRYGNVLRLSIEIEPNDYSDAIQADATQLPLQDDARFDLGVMHPPCGGVSPMSDTGSGSRDEWPDLIPEAREIAHNHCDHWIIENKPRESLDAEVTLTGHMFELGIECKRAFETSFPVEQPAQQNRLAETGPFTYTEWSHGQWAACKGSTMEFGHQHLAKNTIPAAYLDYLMRHYFTVAEEYERRDYSDYDKEMSTRRRKEQNDNLLSY